MKRFFPFLVLAIISIGLLTAAAPVPTVTFTLLQGLPDTMNVGDVATVIVRVDSDQEFISTMARSSFQYPGKGVVAVQGGDREGRGTSAIVEVTYEAKSPTERMENGVAPVYTFVGVRYQGGFVAVQQYLFYVTVP